MRRYIAEGLYKYISEYHSVWHMPGHKRKKYPEDRSGLDTAYIDDLLNRIDAIDLTEVSGTDDLHNPTGMIKASEDELAKVYHTFASYYLVNGSTCGIMAAVAACCEVGDKIIIAGNCHKSVHNIAKLLSLDKIYIPFSNNDYMKSINVDEVKRHCVENPDAKAVVITSPTYEGVVSDIKSISEITKTYNMKLIVDEAHGAALPFLTARDEYTDVMKLPVSAIYLGADIVVESLHKTLPSMTQTAILHVQDEGMDKDIRNNLSIFMSSSPSYIMLCSMERAIAIVSECDYTAYLRELKKFRDKFNADIKNFSLLDKDYSNEIFAYDSTRLVIKVVSESLTGTVLESILSDRYDIVCEMSGINYVVLISTIADEGKDFEYLYNSIKELDDNYDKAIIGDKNYYDESYIKKTVEKIDMLEGTIAKDNIYVYPPGIYLIKKDEIYTREKLDELLEYVKSGKRLHGEL